MLRIELCASFTGFLTVRDTLLYDYFVQHFSVPCSPTLSCGGRSTSGVLVVSLFEEVMGSQNGHTTFRELLTWVLLVQGLCAAHDLDWWVVFGSSSEEHLRSVPSSPNIT